MGRCGASGRIAINLDDRVVLWKPQPSHLVKYGPRERSLVSLIPLLNILWKRVGSKIGFEGLICIGLPCIKEICVVGHVLADRREVDTGGDTQTRELGLITDSREHEKLWSVEHPRTQDHLFAGCDLPPLALNPVNERIRVIWHVDSLEDPVERPNSTPLKQGVAEPWSVASRSFVA